MINALLYSITWICFGVVTMNAMDRLKMSVHHLGVDGWAALRNFLYFIGGLFLMAVFGITLVGWKQ
jgi:hypothetical protein